MLSWQGQLTGPHTLREIQALLRAGKIHSLFKVEREGEWLLLRDHLADVNLRAGDTSRDIDAGPPPPEPRSQPLPPPIMFHQGPNAAVAALPASAADDGAGGDSQRLAIATFVLSLFFFVPYLNAVTWLLALILGHRAMAQSDTEKDLPAGGLAWLGLWLCYVEISLFLLALMWLAALDIPTTNWVYLGLHGRMFLGGLAALAGAGLLMLGLQLTTGTRPGMAQCFVSALAPSACWVLGLLIVQTTLGSANLTSGTGLVLIGGINVAQFCIQMFYWGSCLPLPDGSKLGLPRAALMSLPYSVIFAMVGIGCLIVSAAIG